MLEFNGNGVYIGRYESSRIQSAAFVTFIDEENPLNDDSTVAEYRKLMSMPLSVVFKEYGCPQTIYWSSVTEIRKVNAEGEHTWSAIIKALNEFDDFYELVRLFCQKTEQPK